MSPTTKVLVCVIGAQVAKIAIMQAIGHTARKQLKKTHPHLVRYHR